jgi:hypothetical protein
MIQHICGCSKYFICEIYFLSEENGEKQSAHAFQYDCCCFSARNKMAVSSTKKAKVSKTETRENVKIKVQYHAHLLFLYQRNYSL